VSIRGVVNLSLFEEGWYTREWELPGICRIAEQKLSIEVHCLKLQLNYRAQITEAILELGNVRPEYTS